MSNSCCTLAASVLTTGFSRSPETGPILDGFSRTFDGGSIYVLMGPNGCGKSTLIRALAGELPAQGGAVAFHCTNGHARSFEYLPQDYRQALFPWKTVAGNILPWSNEESYDHSLTKSIESTLEEFGLGITVDRYPHQLSGGQQQAVLLVRCMYSSARVILLDEPFSALDIVRRSIIADHLRNQLRWRGQIAICALHEPDEAATLADEAIILNGPPVQVHACIAKGLEEGHDFSRVLKDTVHALAEGGRNGPKAYHHIAS